MAAAVLSRRHTFFRLVSPLVARCIPDRQSYPFCLGLSRAYGHWLQRGHPRRSDFQDGNARLLALGLRELAYLGRAFDIPLRVCGLNRVTEAYGRHRRLIVLSIHFPLNLVVYRALFPTGIPITVVSAMARDATWPVCGMPEIPEPDIVPPGPALYIRLRAALARERLIIADIDGRHRDGVIELTPRPMQFAARTGTPVVCFATALDADGGVRIVFSDALSGAELKDEGACLAAFTAFMRPFMGEGDRFQWVERDRARTTSRYSRI